MHKKTVRLASAASMFVLMSIVLVQIVPAYATYADKPSLGGGRFQFSDGLTINGAVFDISKFSQTIETQNLAIGQSSKITLKVFDNHGPQSITTALLYLNVQGTSKFTSDTWIQYDVSKGISVHDPNHLLGKVTVSYSMKKPFGYVTFDITPKNKMNPSTIIVSAWDDKKGSVYTGVFNALSFS